MVSTNEGKASGINGIPTSKEKIDGNQRGSTNA